MSLEWRLGEVGPRLRSNEPFKRCDCCDRLLWPGMFYVEVGPRHLSFTCAVAKRIVTWNDLELELL